MNGFSDSSGRILYADEDCLVVNKRPGEAVQGTAGGIEELPQAVAAQFGRPGFMPAAVHRLDVPVSGACLFALTPGASAFLSEAFAQGRVEKYYRGIIEKPHDEAPLPETGELIHWIKTDTKRNKSIAYPEPAGGAKKAVLEYRIIGVGERYLCLEIRLFTGRHHQIRAQLAAVGLHIKGDLKYGARRSEPAGGIRLHSYRLSFPKPAQPEVSIHVTAPPPVMDRLWGLCESW